MKNFIKLILAACVFVSCATKPENIDALYVSPTRYADYSCVEIDEGFREVQSKVNSLTKKQRKQRKSDQVATGVGVVLFWPALFFLMGDDQKEELAQLKGEYEALQVAQKKRDCLETEFANSPDTVTDEINGETELDTKLQKDELISSDGSEEVINEVSSDEGQRNLN